MRVKGVVSTIACVNTINFQDYHLLSLYLTSAQAQDDPAGTNGTGTAATPAVDSLTPVTPPAAVPAEIPDKTPESELPPKKPEEEELTRKALFFVAMPDHAQISIFTIILVLPHNT